ncbi:THAP domain-containing protein 6-like isoform X1 [Hippocampus comes]|uniref:THAP domain-containing protein 6-like isoform X1 n=1 Tax=Hippocampus comes TaxID=109280 RepID=UPI00094EAA30|nr:PREDICTED: THAP domain-containing protein 6-like isoform X1 [Hippocampus comes]XP_019741656.1 PREDICTED: THAP domain-containing protein 6-like isoform X1 [Hippocampus comes]
MPEYCVAHGCKNERNAEVKARKITFHKFPKEKHKRRQWEVALRRKNFVASDHSVLCSVHFNPEDFDRTGQTVRLRAGAIPSVFSLPAHLHKQASKRAKECLELESMDVSQAVLKPAPEPIVARITIDGDSGINDEMKNDSQYHTTDHAYALPPACLLKKRLDEALARVESLERDSRNAKIRESRAKQTVRCLIDELKEKDLINIELQDRLDFYSGLKLDLLEKKGQEYSKDQREFALTLHLHGPKVYDYLRDTLQLPLPHSKTLQKWMGQQPHGRTISDDLPAI